MNNSIFARLKENLCMQVCRYETMQISKHARGQKVGNSLSLLNTQRSLKGHIDGVLNAGVQVSKYTNMQILYEYTS